MKTLLYGGSFDPPHNGHLNNLRAAVARVRPDRVVVMPAGLSPFKQHTAAPAALRLEMCGCFRQLAQPEGCSFFCQQKKEPKKIAAVSTQRTRALGAARP